MAHTGTIYAWADEVVGGPVHGVADHTWVTSYDGPYSPPPPSMFWYCRGVERGVGPEHSSRLLLSTEANLELARRIARPDDPSADCGLRYGVDGVCHQMANRILLASIEQVKPVVEKARLYSVSVLFYGTYGRGYAQWIRGLTGKDVSDE